MEIFKLNDLRGVILKAGSILRALVMFSICTTGQQALAASDRGTCDISAGKKIVAVFDWDDTILPTSVIKDSPESLSTDELQELDDVAFGLIKSFQFDDTPVVIISNGSGSWLRESAQTYLPKTNSLLCTSVYESGCTPVISARDHFEAKYPYLKDLKKVEDEDFDKVYPVTVFWKLETFKDFLGCYSRVFSVGDGYPERRAMTSVFADTSSVHISLPAFPDTATIIKNLQYIQAGYSHIMIQNQKGTITQTDMNYVNSLFLNSGQEYEMLRAFNEMFREFRVDDFSRKTSPLCR